MRRWLRGIHSSNAPELRSALLRVVDQRTISSGSVVYPCVPALAGEYSAKLLETWAALGRRFSDTDAQQLQRALVDVLSAGYERSPCALLVVRWEADPPPVARLRFRLEVQDRTMEDEYTEWVKSRPPPLFGAFPDAKVMHDRGCRARVTDRLWARSACDRPSGSSPDRPSRAT